MSRSYRKWAVFTCDYYGRARSKFSKRQAAKRCRRYDYIGRDVVLDGGSYKKVYRSWMIKEWGWLFLGGWVKRPPKGLPGGHKYWVK